MSRTANDAQQRTAQFSDEWTEPMDADDKAALGALGEPSADQPTPGDNDQLHTIDLTDDGADAGPASWTRTLLMLVGMGLAMGIVIAVIGYATMKFWLG